jgi:hypothetical protein
MTIPLMYSSGNRKRQEAHLHIHCIYTEEYISLLFDLAHGDGTIRRTILITDGSRVRSMSIFQPEYRGLQRRLELFVCHCVAKPSLLLDHGSRECCPAGLGKSLAPLVLAL